MHLTHLFLSQYILIYIVTYFQNHTIEETYVWPQPFPVPIASLTDVPPSNAIWRWYRGKLDEDTIVVDEGEEDASNLSCMGFFGERRQPSG